MKESQRIIAKEVYRFLNWGDKQFTINKVNCVLHNYKYWICTKGIKSNIYTVEENDSIVKVANALAKIIEEIQ